jgi:hypothetical protein
MTPKEKLYLELLTVENEVQKMKGQSENNLNLAEFVNSREFKHNARTSKVDKLKEQIESAQKEAKRLAWLETDEGKAYKRKIEKEIKTIWDEHEKLKKDTHDYVQDLVHILLGDSFDVVNFGHCGFKVYMSKGYTKEEIENSHFTPLFEIYHQKPFFHSDASRWILSYASSGEFELGSDRIPTKFLIGLAKFVSDEEALSSLMERLDSFYNQQNALEIELYRLNEKLEDL